MYRTFLVIGLTLECIISVLLLTNIFKRNKNLDELKQRIVIAQMCTLFAIMISTLSYILMLAGEGFYEYDNRTILYVRWLDWTFSTPMLVVSVMNVIGSNIIEMFIGVCFDMLMIVSGVFCALTTDTTSKIIMISFGGLMYIFLIATFAQSIKGRYDIYTELSMKDKIYLNLSKKLIIISFLMWCFYPVLVILGPEFTNDIKKDANISLGVMTDMISKVFLATMIFYTKCRNDLDDTGQVSKIQICIDRVKSLGCNSN